MTYEQFKKKYNNKYVDVDGYPEGWKYQCFDLAQLYMVEVLNLPTSILAGCKQVKNMLKNPKRKLLDEYFYEVKTTAMQPGDLCIWESNHIAIYDHYESPNCYYFSQNPNKCQVIQVHMAGLHAFRKKGSQTQPSKPDQVLYKGSKVRFYGTQINSINKKNDTFASTFYSGNGRKECNYLPLKPFYRVGANGKWYINQKVSLGNWVKNDNIYTVKQVSKQSARLDINGKDVWVLSRCLEEIADK